MKLEYKVVDWRDYNKQLLAIPETDIEANLLLIAAAQIAGVTSPLGYYRLITLAYEACKNKEEWGQQAQVDVDALTKKAKAARKNGKLGRGELGVTRQQLCRLICGLFAD